MREGGVSRPPPNCVRRRCAIKIGISIEKVVGISAKYGIKAEDKIRARKSARI
jgi:hypothetical protein